MSQNSRLFLYNILARFVPGRCSGLRVRMLRWCGVDCDRSVFVSEGTRFYGNGRFALGSHCVIRGDVRLESNGMGGGGIEIGKYVEINHGSYLAANGGSTIRIGDHCRIAHGVLIKTSSHEINGSGVCIAGAETFQNIDIGDGSWICAGTIVIPGVKIGSKNVVAAGAVVTKSTADGVLMAGVPAVAKKQYAI